MAVSRFNPDYPDAGLRQVVPASVVVGSGSGSADGNGNVIFSGASSVSLNNVFSSTYRNYKIAINYSASSANVDVNLRWRVGGVSNSTANSYIYMGASSITTTLANVSQTTNTLFIGNVYSGSAGYSSCNIDIFDPFNATQTKTHGLIVGVNSAGSNASYFINSAHTQAVSYDGIEIYPASGTITGTISIYGYRI